MHPLFVAGKSKKCTNPECSQAGEHYHASGVLKISLPHSTYGLDVLAFIGWQHEHEHRQLVEIQKQLKNRKIVKIRLLRTALRDDARPSLVDKIISDTKSKLISRIGNVVVIKK